ncbi:MAG: copper homeostasis protein CutC [Pyrinomonadaceae bacterium]
MNGKVAENKQFVLEVIACSVEDAVNAEEGGADRLEVISGFEFGGYTPPLDLVRAIQDAVRRPLRVMLREEACYGLTEVISIERLFGVANELNKMKVDGVVLGFLHAGQVDVRLTQKVLACAPNLKATFHHAFEDTDDKSAAIKAIKDNGQVDRILAHGGMGTSAERIDRLAGYAASAAPEIQILAGGRVDVQMIREIRLRTQIREFHIGSAARIGGTVNVGLVRRLAEAVRGLYV